MRLLRQKSGLQPDHIIPLGDRGTNWSWNMQWLCAFHNSSKGLLSDFKYRRRNGLPLRDPLAHPYYALVLSILV